MTAHTVPPDASRCVARTRSGARCRSWRFEGDHCRNHRPDANDAPPTPVAPSRRPLPADRRLRVLWYLEQPGDRCGACGSHDGLPGAAVGVYDLAALGGDEAPLCRPCLASDREGEVLSRFQTLWERLTADLDRETCDHLHAWLVGELDATYLASRPDEEWR